LCFSKNHPHASKNQDGGKLAVHIIDSFARSNVCDSVHSFIGSRFGSTIGALADPGDFETPDPNI
jgi:hypothetical protein